MDSILNVKNKNHRLQSNNYTDEQNTDEPNILKVHHFNCGTLKPPLYGAVQYACVKSKTIEKAIISKSKSISSLKAIFSELNLAAPTERLGQLVTHACALETTHGLILVDAGFSMEFLANKSTSRRRQLLYQVQEGPENALIRQLPRAGIDPQSVTDIILTHLDFDHASGCFDFPHARIHVMHDEWNAAMHPASFHEKLRYGYGLERLRSQIHASSQYVRERWKGFACIQPIRGLDDLLVIPLPGHSRGHCGVAFKNPAPNKDTHHSEHAYFWSLHCGDAYIEQNEWETDTTQGLSNASSFLHQNKKHAAQTLLRLKSLSPNIQVFNTHAPEGLLIS